MPNLDCIRDCQDYVFITANNKDVFPRHRRCGSGRVHKVSQPHEELTGRGIHLEAEVRYVSLFFSALYAKCPYYLVFFSALYAKCLYSLVLYMQSVLIL